VNASQQGESQPVFVLSCNRAGSTLLRFILDTHPEIYCPPELFLGQAAHSMGTFLSGLAGWESFQETDQEFLVAEAVREPLRAFLDERLATYTAGHGKRLWCEKTPNNVYHLKLLDALYPEAKHVCLYRHGLDVVVSAMRMAKHIPSIQRCIHQSSGHALTGTIRWWCGMTREILAFERGNPDRCLRIRYEDMVADPARALEPVFSFLGVAWDERMLDAVFTTEHELGHEDPNVRFNTRIHRESLGTGADLPLEEVPGEVLAEMRRLLAELGYPEVNARATAGAEAAAEITMPWFFEQFLPGQIAAMPAMAASINTSFRFAVDGPGGGSWIVDLHPDRLGVRPENGQALSTIMVSASDLAAISHGILNASKAYSQGRLRLAGTVALDQVQKLTQLLLQPSAKPF
jgi:protein-tyrosine sulfotransferase